MLNRLPGWWARAFATVHQFMAGSAQSNHIAEGVRTLSNDAVNVRGDLIETTELTRALANTSAITIGGHAIDTAALGQVMKHAQSLRSVGSTAAGSRANLDLRGLAQTQMARPAALAIVASLGQPRAAVYTHIGRALAVARPASLRCLTGSRGQTNTTLRTMRPRRSLGHPTVATLFTAPVRQRLATRRTRWVHVVALVTGPTHGRASSGLASAALANAIPSSHSLDCTLPTVDSPYSHRCGRVD